MILIFLVSSLQFSVYKMECLITGNSQVSLSNFDDCESKNKRDCSVSEECCCFHQVDLNFDYDTKIGANSVKILTPLFSLAPSFAIDKVTAKEEKGLFNHHLPPPSGTELLKAIQVFRI